MDPKDFHKFQLAENVQLNHNTHLLRFKLPTEESVTGMTVAGFLIARGKQDGKDVMRPYTPVSRADEHGFFDLVVKQYPQGVLSRQLCALKPGDEFEFKGPIPKLEVKPNKWAKVGMVAGGTGITPMLQVARYLLETTDDRTEITLVFANNSEEDILLRDELTVMQRRHPRFKVVHTLTQPPAGWAGHKGHVDVAMLKQHLPAPGEKVMIMVCGPPGMMAHVSGTKTPKFEQGEVSGVLKELGYNSSMVFKF